MPEITDDTKVLVRVLCAGFTTVCECILFVAFRANLLDTPWGYGYVVNPEDFGVEKEKHNASA